MILAKTIWISLSAISTFLLAIFIQHGDMFWAIGPFMVVIYCSIQYGVINGLERGKKLYKSNPDEK